MATLGHLANVKPSAKNSYSNIVTCTHTGHQESGRVNMLTIVHNIFTGSVPLISYRELFIWGMSSNVVANETWLPSKPKITLANLAKVDKFLLAKYIFF